ncbi:tetratricopeptide repeat protein [Aggregicoccus sp. 17bor-14]|nr:tetratricopeptide repeat protein [Simulacricoccus sp. 17bor-14]MRI91317.1 tetratricopeptide repeat protein [Aggregicoccus sp. 17bor-14]
MGRGPTGPSEAPSLEDEFLHQLHRGGELLAAGKVAEAKDYLERAHRLQPKNEKGQNLLGLAYFRLGLFDRAAELYERLVRDNPVEPTLRVNLGLVYLKTQALARAVREFEVATDLAPEHKKAQNYLGLALAQAGEYGRAREHFLLAGSDAMAEKMARAIAGEAYARPTPPPPPASSRAAPPPPPPAPAASASGSSEEDWGAQFGLEDGAGQTSAAAPPDALPPEPLEEEEIRFAEDEGPSADERAAPPPPPPAARSARTPVPVDDPFAETSAALAASAPLAAGLPELALSADEAVHPPRLGTAPAEAGPAGPAQAGQLAALVHAVALPQPEAAQPFHVEHGVACVRVSGELLLRLQGLVASRGSLHLAAEPKRFRGRATEKPFGEGASRMMRLQGEGSVFLETGGRVLVPVLLGEEDAYLSEGCVFGFQESVTFENGRVPLEGSAPPGSPTDLDLVHLHGPGAVLLSLPGILRSVPVGGGEAVSVPIEHLVGWQGSLAPRLLGLQQGGVGVELSGEGHALIALPLRPVMG